MGTTKKARAEAPILAISISEPGQIKRNALPACPRGQKTVHGVLAHQGVVHTERGASGVRVANPSRSKNPYGARCPRVLLEGY